MKKRIRYIIFIIFFINFVFADLFDKSDLYDTCSINSIQKIFTNNKFYLSGNNYKPNLGKIYNTEYIKINSGEFVEVDERMYKPLQKMAYNFYNFFKKPLIIKEGYIPYNTNLNTNYDFDKALGLVIEIETEDESQRN